MELKKGTTVKTFIPKVAEGVFTVICMFTDSDEYVLYYHSGKKTLRIFRTNDAQMIANYKMQAELTAIKSTRDGQSLVLGTVDGCLSVFSIADPEKPELQEMLKQLPSRDINVSDAPMTHATSAEITSLFVSCSGRRSSRKSKRRHDLEPLISQSRSHPNSTCPPELKIMTRRRRRPRRRRRQQLLQRRQSENLFVALTWLFILTRLIKILLHNNC